MRSINSGRVKGNDKMLLSSRAQPPRPLKDFPYPSRSSLSVKQFLLSSPLPSPALPALVPRHGKKPPPFNSRRAIRGLSWLAILVTIYSIVSFLLGSGNSAVSRLSATTYLTSSGKAYQIVADSELPEYPTPIGIVDKKGKKKWTVSIPEKLGFPLQAADYADICAHVPEVANHVSSKPHSSTFLDVEEAEEQGLLPRRKSSITSTLPTCPTSLTYVLDATDAGLGSTLMGLWISYALAKQQSRAFFIDDTHFAYGTYTSFFMPPPIPQCRPPRSSQRLPCPMQARHLIVSAATFRWTFGTELSSLQSSSSLFDLARQGYNALFKLRSDDAGYVQQRITELRGTSTSANKVIGIHLRRGDRHPFTLAYSQAYLPPTMYMSAASELSATHFPHSTSTTILATDDPEIYTASSSLSHLARAQSRITLASKSSLNDGGIGWEGGFFSALFFSLGLPPEAEWQKRINSPLPSRMVAEMGEADKNERDYRTDPTKEAREMRALIGRAYLLDLAVLGQGTDGVVCAVSSYTCRLLGIMMGAKKVKSGLWMNLEVGYEWRAFDL